MGELEKLGQKYRVALRIARDPRFERLPCTHKVRFFRSVLISQLRFHTLLLTNGQGTYADDCICERIAQVSITLRSIHLVVYA